MIQSIEELETALLAEMPVQGAMTKLGLIDRLFDRLSQLVDLLGDLPKEAILEMLGQVYDDYLAPLDIPGVPNILIEPKLDEMLRVVFLEIAARIIDRVNQ